MARKKRKRIASRGSVNTTILKTLINGDKYGYEIIKEVEEYSDGKIVLKQPSLYSSLSRFEEKGIVSSYWGDSDIGGRRHYYHLTELGHKYYNTNVLKIKDEDDEDDEDEKPIITPLENNAIPEVLNFDTKKQEEPIPDHNFYQKTPIDNIPNKNIEEDKDYELIKKLANQVKITNKRYINSPLKRLHIIKPKKSQKVVLDTDGIFKLRDEDYIAKSVKPKESIIDNVIKRSNKMPYGYPTYTEQKQHIELSDEEKKKKNELFLEKFNNLTKSRYKPVENKIIEKPKEVEKDIDYRSKLNSVIENNAFKSANNYSNVNLDNQVNNLFNYEEEQPKFENLNTVVEDEEDKFIDFEPTQFDVKSDNSYYNEEISNITSTTSSVQINRYEHKSKVIAEEKSFVLINKVKLIFGIILGIFLISELAVSYIVFNKLNLIASGDKTLFIVSLVLSIIIMLGFMIPYFVNSSQHALNNFKLKLALTYGILLFLVSVILIYCINALAGFELDNFKSFATKIILPIILTFNFVIMPPIYSAIIKNKKYYD